MIVHDFEHLDIRAAQDTLIACLEVTAIELCYFRFGWCGWRCCRGQHLLLGFGLRIAAGIAASFELPLLTGIAIVVCDQSYHVGFHVCGRLQTLSGLILGNRPRAIVVAFERPQRGTTRLGDKVEQP